MPRRERSLQAKVRRDREQWLQHEAPLLKARMRDNQTWLAQATAAPAENIEIEDPGTPATPRSSTELFLKTLQDAEHLTRRKAGGDQGGRVREVPAGAAACRIEDDRRGVKQVEASVELGDGRTHHPCWPAVAAVRAIGADRDGIKVLIARQWPKS